MNPTNPNMNSSISIDRAEKVVQKNLDRFETAIEQLADKVEGAARKIYHVRNITRDGKQKLMHLKDEVRATINPLKPSLNKFNTTISSVRALPRQYLWIAVGIMGFLAWRLLKNSSLKSRSPSGPGYAG